MLGLPKAAKILQSMRVEGQIVGRDKREIHGLLMRSKRHCRRVSEGGTEHVVPEPELIQILTASINSNRPSNTRSERVHHPAYNSNSSQPDIQRITTIILKHPPLKSCSPYKTHLQANPSLQTSSPAKSNTPVQSAHQNDTGIPPPTRPPRTPNSHKQPICAAANSLENQFISLKTTRANSCRRQIDSYPRNQKKPKRKRMMKTKSSQ